MLFPPTPPYCVFPLALALPSAWDWCIACISCSEQTYAEAIKDMPWKGIVHSNATVANLIRKAEIRVLPAVIVVDDKVFMSITQSYSWIIQIIHYTAGSCTSYCKIITGTHHTSGSYKSYNRIICTVVQQVLFLLCLFCLFFCVVLRYVLDIFSLSTRTAALPIESISTQGVQFNLCCMYVVGIDFPVNLIIYVVIFSVASIILRDPLTISRHLLTPLPRPAPPPCLPRRPQQWLLACLLEYRARWCQGMVTRTWCSFPTTSRGRTSRSRKCLAPSSSRSVLQ